MSDKGPAKKVARKVAKKTAPAKKVEAVKPDSCETCRFGKIYDDKMMMCRRYPSPPGVRDQSTMLKDGWCGEFKAL